MNKLPRCNSGNMSSVQLVLLILVTFDAVTALGWTGIDPCLDPISCFGNLTNIKVSDPENCSQYFICSGTSLYPQICPSGFQFDQNIGLCLDIRTNFIHCGSCLNDEYNYTQYIVYPSTTQGTPLAVTNETTSSDTLSRARSTLQTTVLLTSSAIERTSEAVTSQTTPSTSKSSSVIDHNILSTTFSTLKPTTSQSRDASTVFTTSSKTSTMSESTIHTSSLEWTTSRLPSFPPNDTNYSYLNPTSSPHIRESSSLSSAISSSETTASFSSSTTETTSSKSTHVTTDANVVSSARLSVSARTATATLSSVAVATSLPFDEKSTAKAVSSFGSTYHEATTISRSTSENRTTTYQTSAVSGSMDNKQKTDIKSTTGSTSSNSTNYHESTTQKSPNNNATATSNPFTSADISTIVGSHSSNSTIQSHTSKIDDRITTTNMKPTASSPSQTTVSLGSFNRTSNISLTTILDVSTTGRAVTSIMDTTEPPTTILPSTKIPTTISQADLWKLCNRANPCIPGNRYGDVVDCTKYFECVTFLESDNYLMPMACPDGYIFNAFKKNCTNRTAEDGNEEEICSGKVCEMRTSHSISVSPVPILSDRKLTVQCSFRVLFVVQPIQVSEFIWQLNGYPLSSTRNAERIQIGSTVWDNMGFWNSSLTFNPVTTRDSGNIDCIVKYGNQLTSINSTGYLTVLPTPTVEMQPLNAVVVRNESITLVCKASFEESAKPSPSTNTTKRNAPELTFSWFRSNMSINFNNDSECNIASRNSNSTVIICKPTVDTVYFCSVNYSYGHSESSLSSVKVVVAGSLLCAPDNKDGAEWVSTEVNTTCVVSCGLDSTGFRTRRCSFVGGSAVWDSPNDDDCVDKELSDLLSQVRDVRQGISLNNPNTTEEIAEGLRNYLSSVGSELTFGNFNSSLEILQELGSIQTTAWNVTKPGIAEIKSVLWSTSSLLNSTNDALWKNLISQNTLGAIPLMDVVNVYGKKWAKTLEPGNSDTIAYGYLAMSTVCDYARKIQYFSFPSFNVSDNQGWMNATKDHIYFQNPSNLRNGDNDTIYYISSSLYRNLNDYFPTATDIINSSHVSLGSRIIALTVDGLSDSKNLSIPVQMVFENIKAPNNNATRNCVFWNSLSKSSGVWSDNGCLSSVASSNPTTTICECNHLTNFAILFSQSPAKDADKMALQLISIIGCIVSIASLVLLLVLFAVRWKRMRSHNAVVLINLCIALIAANAVFLGGVDKTADKTSCTVVAVWLHFLFLAAFCAMLVEGIQLLLYVARPFYVHRKRETVLLIVTAWAIPLIIVGVSLAVTRTDGYGGEDSCWLSTKNNVLWAFVAPALAIISTNFVILVIVLVRIARTRRATEQPAKYRVWATVWNVFMIVPVLGITWVFGVFSVNDKLVVFQYIFAIANSFQGFFIFLFHGLCHRKHSKSKTIEKKNSIRQMWDETPPQTPGHPPSHLDDPTHSVSRGTKAKLENHWRRLSKRHAVNWVAVAAAAVASSTDHLELQNCSGYYDDSNGVWNERRRKEETFSRSLRPNSSQSEDVVTPRTTSTDKTDILF